MKNICFFLFLTLSLSVSAQIIDFPDANFKNALVNTICVDTDGDGGIDSDADSNDDGEVDVSEAMAVINLEVPNQNISNLDGIEYFKNLKGLDINFNQIKSLDLREISGLVWLQNSENKLEYLNLAGLTNLILLDSRRNQLTSLNLQGLTKLRYLAIDENQLTSLDAQELVSLETLSCELNQLTSLEVQGLVNLEVFSCGYNKLTSLDVKGLVKMESLRCVYNKIAKLEIEELTNLRDLACEYNQLTSLAVVGIPNLVKLSCNNNRLSVLNIVGSINLLTLDCSYNELTTLNFQELINLNKLNCNNNQLKSISVQGFNILRFLNCSKNQLSSLDVQGLVNLQTLYCEHNQLASIDLKNLVNLVYLYCGNNNILSLDFIESKNLKEITCNSNKIADLSISGLDNLTNLSCKDNQMNSLKLHDLSRLKYIYCGNNQLLSLDFKGLSSLATLWCENNQLKNLELEGLPSFNYLVCPGNQLSSLDFSNVRDLEVLSCEDNPLTELDLAGLTKLRYLDCYDSELVTINMKGIRADAELHFQNNPVLRYICCDDDIVNRVKGLVVENGQNCEVNSYCSFTPGGKFYTIQLNNTYDANSNGCDDQDSKIPYIKYNITNGTISGTFITNSTGSYAIPVQEGIHTITPLIENPEHYLVSPSSFTVTFPSTSDTIMQDFCITPKDVFSKINITVLPLSPPARPGFETTYKIVWENIGNQIENGPLDFTYEYLLFDYISATIMPNQIVDGTLSWYFTNLLPFEKREIIVKLKVNRPTDVHPVNSGDKLYLTAAIYDNVFTLENTVVGSYDPNDKTCLQGDRVHPDMIGEYVDYMIRFENTGNYAAENVVVKDIINTLIFDVSTLQITDSSHELYTRIEDNKVEFIFEKIQLPFNDENNDGYIAFKIKTLPTLVLGDSLKNLADIYFDYNFPVRTNEAQTKVALPVSTADITTDIHIYPNPVKDILHLDTNDNWTKVELFDLSGRILRALTTDVIAIDVSNLASGTYIVRLRNGDKVGRVKFVKL